MTGRVDFDPNNPPAIAGWYGLVHSDGENEFWVGAAYWGPVMGWQHNVGHTFVRSDQPFATVEEAMDWAHAQPD